MDEEYWCMQWCGEVLPEPAMIPDLGVFLRSAPAHSQAVIARGHSHAPPVSRDEETMQPQGPIPARLKLPFLLSLPGENKVLAADLQSAVLVVMSDKQT